MSVPKFNFTKMKSYLGLFIVFTFLKLISCSSIKTVCNKPADSECHEGWTPIPNLGAALVGYDLPAGNPFADDFIEDPGLRKQIFNATMPFEENSVGGFKLETGINARQYKMCDEKFVSHLATNIKSYKRVAMKSSTSGRGYDIGIEADVTSDGSNFEGSLPPLVNIAWDVSPDAKNAASFFTRTRGAIAIAEAQCITHKVDVSPFLTPHFHPSFVEVLMILEKQDSEVKQIRAFKGFVRDYGTHYLSSVYLGAKISATSYFTSFERLKNGARGITDCAILQASIKFEMANDTVSVKCWDNENNDAELNGLTRTRLTTYGSKPTSKELSQWKDQEITPIPIKFELTPIVNLFTAENLDERYNISSTNILEWFLPLYLKYCKVLKYGCTVPTGCGIDDECKFEDTCVIDRLASKGYRCQATSWADIPNWPQLASGAQPVLMASISEEKPESPSSESTSETPASRRSDDPPQGVPNLDPEPANISWFRSQDYDSSNTLSLEELLMTHQDRGWFNQRYRSVMERLFIEADVNGDRFMDMNEFIRLHQKHPWYPEQLSFLLVNTDNNGYLTKEELLEASKASPDMVALQINHRQLENLVDGVMAIGDKNSDKRITFDEYVQMASDTFIENLAPNTLKRIFMH